MAFLAAWIGGQAGVGQCGNVGRRQPRVQADNCPGVGLEQLGESTVGGDAGESGLDAVHVVAGPAGLAEAARDERVDDHRIADGHMVDGGADGLDPAGVLVAERVRECDAGLLPPLTLDDVEVGPAEAGPADADDDVEGMSQLGFGDFLHFGIFAIAVQADGLHRSLPTRCPPCPAV